jgi:hypothetical protein
VTDERIPLNPLDAGDDFQIEVEAGITDAETAEPMGMDCVAVYVPDGKGVVFAAWLERQLTETPEDRQRRIEEDNLALLKEPTA